MKIKLKNGRLSKEGKNIIIQEYLTEKYTCRDLERKYNIYFGGVWNLLKKEKVSINNDQSKLQRKYNINHNYFDTINTEEKAYFLGLMYADGYNQQSLNRISLQLQDDDK